MFRAFLETFPECSGAALAALDVEPDPDFNRLAKILAGGGSSEWNGLRDALCDIDSLATETGRQDLTDLVKKSVHDGGFTLAPTLSNADVSLAVWLRDRSIFDKALQNRILRHSRRFHTFLPRRTEESVALKLDAPHWAAFESTVVAHHLDLGGQPGTKVFVIGPGDEETWFLIQHGQELHRLGAVEGMEVKSVALHPQVADVLIYSHTWGALRIRANNAKSVGFYKVQFAQHLLGDPDYLGEDGAYFLDRLRLDLRGALYCGDIDGARAVRLVRLLVGLPSKWRESVEYRASDLFAAWESRSKPFPRGRIRSATFEFVLRAPNSKSDRLKRMTVDVPYSARVSQDADGSLLTAWMQAREMCREAGDDDVASFWRIFEHEGPLDATLEEWQQITGPDWDDCAALFRNTAETAASLPCPLRVAGCERRLVGGDATGFVATCQGDGVRCSDERIELEDAQLHRFDVSAFRQGQRRFWSLTGQGDSGDARTSQVGLYKIREGLMARVFLLLGPPGELPETIARLIAESPSRAILLVPGPEGLDPMSSNLVSQHGWEFVSLQDCQRIVSGRVKGISPAEDVLAGFRAAFAGPAGSADAGHHAFRVAHLSEGDFRGGIEKADVERLKARTDVDLLVDFATGTASSPSGKAGRPPESFRSRNLGLALRTLATSARALTATEMHLPGGGDSVRALQDKITQLRTPLKRLTEQEWIATSGPRGEHVYEWNPPVGWTFALLFPVETDV